MKPALSNTSGSPFVFQSNFRYKKKGEIFTGLLKTGAAPLYEDGFGSRGCKCHTYGILKIVLMKSQVSVSLGSFSV